MVLPHPPITHLTRGAAGAAEGELCDGLASLVPLIACLDDHALEFAVPWLRAPKDPPGVVSA